MNTRFFTPLCDVEKRMFDKTVENKIDFVNDNILDLIRILKDLPDPSVLQ